MADSITRVTTRSWGSRLKGAFGGVIFGVALVAGGSMMLFWNEGRAVKRFKTLKEGASSVRTVPADRVDSAMEGQLVHTSGMATTDAILRDERFGVQVSALRLNRDVEMYQWVEHTSSEDRKKLGGGTETVTTYSYEREWTSRPVSSSSFEEPRGHQNPPFPVSAEEWRAEPIELGAFVLGGALAGQISRDRVYPVDDGVARRARGVLGRTVRVSNGELFAGASESSPEIGDLKIRYRVVEPAEVSVVGGQRGSALGAYTTRVGGTIALLSYGEVPADQMFQAAQTSNRVLAWILRGVGFFVLFLAFGMIFRPLSVLADVVPFIGRLVATGTGFVAFVLAALVSLAVIAVGWIFYRPLLGLGLLAVAVVLVVWLWRRSRKATVELPPLPQQEQASGLGL